MARTALTPVEAPGGRPLSSVDAAGAAADVGNGNKFAITGREMLLVRNTGASTRTLTFQTVAVNGRQDPNHNTAINVTAGAVRLFGPFPLKEYQQTDGALYVSSNHAELLLTVIRLPN